MADKTPGWFNDPYGRFQQRYFDGKKWTEHVATGGEQQVDPLGSSTVIPIATPPTAFAAPGKSSGVVKLLDAMGPDSRERPLPSIRSAVAGLGGVVLAFGIYGITLGDDPSRGQIIATSLVLIAAAWALRTFVRLAELQAAAVGIVVIAIPVLAVAVTVDQGVGGFWTGLLLAALFIAAWALPGFKSRNLLLGLGALALVFSFGSLTSTDGSSSNAIPTPITDNTGDQGIVYLIGAALYFGLTWWLDRRGHRGTATAFAAAGLVSTIIGTVIYAAEFGEDWAPIFVLAVGIIVSLVGSHGARRATTWWGAVLSTIAVVWFVAVQWEPDSNTENGGVAIVSGLVLVAIPFLTAPIRKLMQARRPASAPPEPPPPFEPSA